MKNDSVQSIKLVDTPNPKQMERDIIVLNNNGLFPCFGKGEKQYF